MGVRQMATLEVRGLGLSCVLPFWPLWLTIPAQAGVPSSWRGGIFHKLHFYLKENKGPASWCPDSPHPRSPGPVPSIPQRRTNSFQAGKMLGELEAPCSMLWGQRDMFLLSDSQQLPTPGEDGERRTSPGKPKILEMQSPFPSWWSYEINGEETSGAIQERGSSQGFTNC